MRCKALFLLVFILFSTAAAGDYYPIVKSYRLDVSFLPEEAEIIGRGEVQFEEGTDYSLDGIFYLHGEIRIDSILVNNKAIDFEQTREYYRYDYSNVATKGVFSLKGAERGAVIYYHGKMNPSVVGAPSNYMRIDRDGVFLRSYGYSLWFPVFLPEFQNAYHADFPEMVVRIPEEFHPVVAGRKVEEVVSQGFRKTVWSMDNMSLFMVQCTARRYSIMSEGNVRVYSTTDSLSLRSGKEILAFAEELIGKFTEYYGQPENSEEYYIIEMPKYGDISSGNVSGIQKEVWQSFTNLTWPKRVLAHELVHPFVWVRPERSDRFFALAVEGFPSWLHLPVLAELLGDEWYREFVRKRERDYLEMKASGKDRRGRALPEEKPILGISAEEVGRYKDKNILGNRVILLFDYFYRKMGKKRFIEFSKELFGGEVSETQFRNLIEKYVPGSAEDIRIWLETNDFPERFKM